MPYAGQYDQRLQEASRVEMVGLVPLAHRVAADEVANQEVVARCEGGGA
jgi:hypothetical protein